MIPPIYWTWDGHVMLPLDRFSRLAPDAALRRAVTVGLVLVRELLTDAMEFGRHGADLLNPRGAAQLNSPSEHPTRNDKR